MIYVLMERYLNDEDNFGEPIFASKSIEACEKKHYELQLEISLNKRMSQHYNKCFAEESKKFGERPKVPNIAALPAKPLIWDNEANSWKNSYIVEHEEREKEYYKKLSELSNSITNELALYYKVDRSRITSYVADPDFSIEEVESDIE